MTIEQMKSRIISVYDNKKWKDRVATMKPNQIVAIYKNFESSGKFNLHRVQKNEDKREAYHQMTIFEFM